MEFKRAEAELEAKIETELLLFWGRIETDEE